MLAGAVDGLSGILQVLSPKFEDFLSCQGGQRGSVRQREYAFLERIIPLKCFSDDLLLFRSKVPHRHILQPSNDTATNTQPHRQQHEGRTLLILRPKDLPSQGSSLRQTRQQSEWSCGVWPPLTLHRSSDSPTESASHSSSNVRTQERSPGPLSAVSSTRRVLPRKFTRRRARSPQRLPVVSSVSTSKLSKPREPRSQKSVLLLVKRPSSKLRSLRLPEPTLPRLTLQSPLAQVLPRELVQTRASNFWL